MQSKQIQLFLINGFLGSGKTSFLLKLLSLFSSQKCGVLMNEFGEIGIDGLLLPQKEIELIEINGGSIFCQCRHDTFIEALIQFSTTPIDILFIEASGLADPVTMDNDFQIVRKKIGEIYTYSGSICIIDSLHFLDLVNVVQTIERQIQHASLAIINKIDLTTPERVLGIKDKVCSINPRIKLIETSYGDLSQDQIVNLYSERAVTEKGKNSTCTTRKSAIDISLRADHRLDSKKARKFFSKLAKETRRMKGFIQLDDNQWYFLDSVNGSLSIRLTNSEYPQTMIVVIFRAEVEEKIVNMVKSRWVSLIA
ncbi:MAG: CobW family GTP-binding protein [Candidatus Hodarchaeota archaeon]